MKVSHIQYEEKMSSGIGASTSLQTVRQEHYKNLSLFASCGRLAIKRNIRINKVTTMKHRQKKSEIKINSKYISQDKICNLYPSLTT
jgi:hypothetical protein